MSVRDDIDKKYRISNKFNDINSILFWFVFGCSISSCFFNNINFRNIIILLQIIFSSCSVFIKIIDDIYFWYEAETSRRKSAIENGFAINMQIEKTDGYYNNHFKPSIFKYGVNIFESNYFSCEIVKRMIPKSIFKATISIFILFMSTRFIKSNEILLVITQTIFSSNFILDSIRLISYLNSTKRLYDEAYQFFITDKHKNKNSFWIQWYVVEYETLKAYYKLRLDSKIFNKINNELTEKWETMELEIS